MTMAEGELNYILLKLSNEMREYDLQNLKHLCHGKIPLGDLEKAKSARDVFRIMQQKLLIRPGKLDLLEGMLKQVGRADLAKKLQPGSGADTTMETESALRSNSSDANYRGFLMSLSDELTKENVESLKFIADLPRRWFFCLFNRLVLYQNTLILRKSIDCCSYLLFDSLLIHCWRQPGRVVGEPDLKSGDPECKSSSDDEQDLF